MRGQGERPAFKRADFLFHRARRGEKHKADKQRYVQIVIAPRYHHILSTPFPFVVLVKDLKANKTHTQRNALNTNIVFDMAGEGIHLLKPHTVHR